MSIYNNKKIVVLGAGLTGLSCINYFISLNIYPKLIDTRFLKIKNIPNGIKYHFGSFNDSWILNSDLIVISPGISSYNYIIKKAINKNIEIINDIEIFCREISKPVIAITGTNGKSTVVSLLFKIFKSYGINVSCGGNIGIPVLDLLKDKSDLYILELSSFQLEYVYSLKTICSSILNITYDHIDRYPNGIQDYVFSKWKIFNNSEYCIINYSNKFSLPYNIFEKNIITFGIKKGDYYIDFYKGNIFLSCYNKKIINVKDIFLKGIFNYLNLLVVICICDIFKISRNILLKILVEFKGLSHRFNIISRKNNILWINDSKSTNVGSTISALSNLNFVKGNIWLLLGGNGKSVNFSKLLKPYLLLYKNLFICCFGKYKDILYNLIPNISFKFNNMNNSFLYILKNVKPNDVVLLSPGCSSLDQFNNYIDRGNKFINLVKKYT